MLEVNRSTRISKRLADVIGKVRESLRSGESMQVIVRYKDGKEIDGI